MRILLAPMEGVIDHTMRALLTALGGIDRCVTEFLRVTDHCQPRRTFYRLCPELAHGSRTPSGVPVFLQLLGGKPEPMAANAARAADLGAAGIDLNFGCPARLVNRNDGGAVLLREPERLYAIITAVRAAVPAAIPVTAKVRLGFDTADGFDDIAAAVVAAGASELAVHARTKSDGYRPPAYWERIGRIRGALPIPVVVNGEIWSPADAAAALAASDCNDLMLGRGALAWPDLPRLLRTVGSDTPPAAEAWRGETLAWPQVVALLLARLDASIAELAPRHAPNPMKQWLHYLQRQYPQATQLFERIKRETVPADCRRLLLAEMSAAAVIA